jgi:YHS domain-containing protein
MKEMDLFCGMEVEPETAAAQYEYNGKTYYFCDRVCKQMFMLNPEKYIRINVEQNKK